ncbi:MAG: ComF family protein [Gammaproteobacteria bacterium]|nr:MAG: ComF family protein [Gammaproteobacteria bacterium]
MLKILKKIEKIIYPPACIICNKPGYNNIDLCKNCYDDLLVNNNCCQKCATPLMGDVTYKICGSCLNNPHKNYHKILSVFIYKGVAKNLVHLLKFKHKQTVAKIMAQLIDKNITLSADAIIPIALHKKRLKTRGFNQATIIASELSKILKIPVVDNILYRHIDTKPQVELSAKLRIKNVSNAFKCSQKMTFKNVILIDDVATTTNTIISAAKTLKKHGCQNITALTFARTSH